MAEHQKFPVEVLTPDGEVFAEGVQMISTRTAVGSIGVLAHHAPLLAMLDPTELRLYRSDSDVVRFAQSEGYLQVADNHALLLVQEAHEPGSLDAGEPNAGNMYDLTPAQIESAGIETLPANLLDATRELERDTALREALGRGVDEDYIDYYVRVKRREWASYHEQVTPWEVERYLTLT